MNGGLATASGHIALSDGQEWNVLTARALDPGSVAVPLAEAILEFGDGFTGLLKDPAAALTHPGIPGTFAQACRRRGIPADTVTAFLLARLPPFPQVIICGHTAVLAGALSAHLPGGSSEIIIDWTARQLDPGVPVPLVVTAADWRAFWRSVNENSRRGRGGYHAELRAAQHEQQAGG